MTENPKLKAIVTIRNLVSGISTDWKELSSLGEEVESLLESYGSLFLKNSNVEAKTKWIAEHGKFKANIGPLKVIMNQVVEKINAKDSSDLASTWDKHKSYSSDIALRLDALDTIGKEFIDDHDSRWAEINKKFNRIRELVESSSLRLAMISEYTPQEVDDMTDTILKHIPMDYSTEDAAQYEKEYLKAYDELKKEASQRKNIWDKFLDILAGGIQQSPAERVMMQRWINGEKGDL